MRVDDRIEVREVEDLYINLNPIQAGGRLTPEARKALIAYGDGYSVCDHCLAPFRLDAIKKPPIAAFYEELAGFVNMDVARVMPGARRGFHAVAQAILKEGDIVLVSAVAHYSLCLAIEAVGAVWREIPLSEGGIVTGEATRAKIEAVRAETGKLPKLVAVSHFDYTLANEHDVTGAAEAAHACGIPFLYNGAYTVGVMPVDAKAIGADFIVGSGHKSMAAPAPTGVLATTSEFADVVFATTDAQGDVTGRRFGVKETHLLGCTVMGAPLVAMMASFPAVRERLKRWPEELEKIGYFMREFLRIEGASVVSEMPRKHAVTKVDTSRSFGRVAEKHRQKGYFLHAALKERGIVGILPGATNEWKLSTYGLSWDQVRYTAGAFLDIAREHGLKVEGEAAGVVGPSNGARAREEAVTRILAPPEKKLSRGMPALRPAGRPAGAGKEHPVCRLNMLLRETFLRFGFDEVVNPMIVLEEEVYRQYGREAPVILDRVFYLAGLPRPDIGLGASALSKLREIVPGFEKEEELRGLLREYKKGDIESDDLVETLAGRLGLSDEQAIRAIDEVFPQFRDLRPAPTKRTLRSHMTSLWFPVLAGAARLSSPKSASALPDAPSGPVRMFSIGPRFRREQREDAYHLFESTTASIVVMDDEFTLEEGEELTRRMLARMGIEEVEFRRKAVASNYYEAGTDTEIYIQFGTDTVEIANLGFYSPKSLANYGIEHRVFNLGFGVERLAMLFEKETDIRRLVNPYLHAGAVRLTDEAIARSLRPERRPASEEGPEVVKALVEAALAARDRTGPVEVLAYEGPLAGSEVKVWVYNWDEGKPLLSYAALNQVYAHDGTICGLPAEEGGKKLPARFRKALEEGFPTGLRFLDLMMAGAVAALEEAAQRGDPGFDVRHRFVRRPADVNLFVPESVVRYITGSRRKMTIVGPVFAGVKAEIASRS